MDIVAGLLRWGLGPPHPSPDHPVKKGKKAQDQEKKAKKGGQDVIKRGDGRDRHQVIIAQGGMTATGGCVCTAQRKGQVGIVNAPIILDASQCRRGQTALFEHLRGAVGMSLPEGVAAGTFLHLRLMCAGNKQLRWIFDTLSHQ